MVVKEIKTHETRHLLIKSRHPGEAALIKEFKLMAIRQNSNHNELFNTVIQLVKVIEQLENKSLNEVYYEYTKKLSVEG